MNHKNEKYAKTIHCNIRPGWWWWWWWQRWWCGPNSYFILINNGEFDLINVYHLSNRADPKSFPSELNRSGLARIGVVGRVARGKGKYTHAHTHSRPYIIHTRIQRAQISSTAHRLHLPASNFVFPYIFIFFIFILFYPHQKKKYIIRWYFRYKVSALPKQPNVC